MNAQPSNHELLLKKFRQHRKAARVLYRNQLYGDCVSRAYYAAFSFMWAYVGDPSSPTGWKHGGLRETFGQRLFEHGLSRDDLRSINKGIAKLYNLRVRADSSTMPVSQQDAQEALRILKDVTRQVKL